MITYEADTADTVGVPVIPQVDESVNPVGKLGLELQDVAVPPVWVATTAAIAVFFVHVYDPAAYVKAGTASFTVTLIVAEEVPPVFVAVITCPESALTAVGVPVIAHVVVSNDNPAGNATSIAHDAIAPPVFVGVLDVIATSFTNVYGEPA